VEATTGFEPVNRGFADPIREIIVAMNEPKQGDPDGPEMDGAGVHSGVSTTLYRFYDKDGALLYVGITSRGPNRWRDHEDSRAWWSTVAMSRVEQYPNRAEALAAERAAIRAERPIHNVVHATPRSERPTPVYRKHGQGSVIYNADRDRWAAVTPGSPRRWFRFRTEAQANAFLAAYVAASDPDVRAALLRALA
jgi:predicted GIY-YIG superfamily endonuclease